MTSHIRSFHKRQAYWKLLKDSTQHADELIPRNAYRKSENLKEKSEFSLAEANIGFNQPKSIRIDRSDEKENIGLSRAKNLDELLIILQGNISKELASGERLFQKLLSESADMHIICCILHEFIRKNHNLSEETLRRVEYILKSSNFKIDIKGFHSFLRFANHFMIYSRLSKGFWLEFTQKIESSISSWPPATLMTCCSQEGYFFDSLYSKMIKKWQINVENSSDFMVFREGFYALANSDYLSQVILNWSFTQFCRLHSKFLAFDVLIFARALTLQNIYNEDLWNILIPRIQSMPIQKLSRKSKSIVYHIYKSLEIDQPNNSAQWLSFLNHIKHEISFSYKAVKSFTKTYSQQYVARILSVNEYEFLQNQYIKDFYEVDLFIPSLNIVIEVIGKPYHISQFNNKASLKLRMKLRHLNKLGFRVILVNDKVSVEQLTKAIHLLNAKLYASISILENELKEIYL